MSILLAIARGEIKLDSAGNLKDFSDLSKEERLKKWKEENDTWGDMLGAYHVAATQVISRFLDENKIEFWKAIERGARSAVEQATDEEVALELKRADTLPPPKKPKFWYFQKWNCGGEAFWDSYVHRDCYELKRRPYDDSPFK